MNIVGSTVAAAAQVESPPPVSGIAGIAMTLARLKLFATITPIAALLGIELARFVVLGRLPLGQRLLLDAIVVGAILAFSAFVFHFIDGMQNRLERQKQELLALHDAGLAVTSELALDAVLVKVVEQARRLVGARYGALSVVDRSGRIEQFITSGITPEERAAIGPPPVGHGVLGVVLHQGHHLRLVDVKEHPASAGFPPNHPVMRSLLAVPVPCKGPFLGNLYLAEKTGVGEFTSDDEGTLERFALQAAIAIDNTHLHGQAADLAVAQERLRIAHEMHDGVAQVLGYVGTKVQAANAWLAQGRTEEASAQLRQLAEAARQAYADVRESIVGLRSLPGPERPLAAVLEEYLAKWREGSNVSTQLTIDPELRLPAAFELQLVRIVQESLANVRKHARTTNARVEVRRREGRLYATVRDDGVGFKPEALTRSEFPRFGLTTMRERAESIGGTLTVESVPGGGTTVRFEVPLAAESSA